MKIECPVCGVIGILEVRGNSHRVLHYKGFVDGKRVYEKHSVKMGSISPEGLRESSFMAVNQSVIGSSPIGGATLHLRFLFSMKSSELGAFSSGKPQQRYMYESWALIASAGSIVLLPH